MSRYRKIDPRIWNDEKFRTFSDDSKLAFLFVLTHPQMTAVGAMRTTLAGLAAEIGWIEDRMRQALAVPISTGMIELDERACFLSLPKFLRYNTPESPNVVAGWRQAIQLLPECDLVQKLEGLVEAELAQLGPAFVDSWIHGERTRPGRPSPDITRRVRARDGDLCRYCEVRVSWNNRRGPMGGTYDHVNPRAESTFDNMVVCCRRCNGRKGLKTPAQAGMTLRNIPDNIQIESRSDSNRNLDLPRIQEQEQLAGEIPPPVDLHSNGNAPHSRRKQRPGFDVFWAAYPNKVGRDEARAVWDRGRTKAKTPIPGLDVLLPAIKSQMAGRKWIEGFVPNPATWLQQGRWQDQVSPEANVPDPYAKFPR